MNSYKKKPSKSPKKLPFNMVNPQSIEDFLHLIIAECENFDPCGIKPQKKIYIDAILFNNYARRIWDLIPEPKKESNNV